MDKQSIINQLENVLITFKSTGEYEKGIDTLINHIRINSLVNYILYSSDNDELDKGICEKIIYILQDIYNNSDIISPISDEDYDKLYAKYLEGSNKNIVGAPIPNGVGKIVSAHSYPDLRGTLDKVHFIYNSEKKPKETRKSLEDWRKSVETRTGTHHDALNVDIFPKWDGISAIFECDADGDVVKVLKRGDTVRNEAEEITDLFIGKTNMKHFDKAHNGPFGVKTEIVMTRDNYEKLCAKYGSFKSPRSAVSSIINSKELDKRMVEYLTIIPLQVQNKATGEITIPDTVYTDYPARTGSLEDLDSIHHNIDKIVEEVHDKLGIDIDGIVIRFKSERLQRLLGREENINKYEVAFKLPPEQKESTLLDIEMSVGLFGTITPVAKIKPIKMKGNMISSISLGSVDRFELLGLRKGDTVLIKYDVIPYLDKPDNYVPSDGELFMTPTHCAVCGEPLVKSPTLGCVNTSCESRIVGKILHYVTKMGIPNISIGIISTLHNEGFLNSIEDLYQLSKHKKAISSLDGFGVKSIANILEGIESRREVEPYVLVGSIGIPDIGRRIFKKILDVYPLDKLIDICKKEKISDLTTIAGIKEKTATKIINGINSNLSLIAFLRKELTIKEVEAKNYTIKVVFTKVRDKDFEAFLDAKGVLVMDSYRKETDMVIVPDYNTSSSKITKARSAGKEIVSIGDAYKLFGYHV